MQQVLGETLFAAILTCCLSMLLLQHEASAQGLEGLPLHIRFGSGPGPLLSGKTAKERWELLLKQMPSLIGMKRGQVIKLFGKGAQVELTDDEDYSIDNLVELRLHFYRNSLDQISIVKIYTIEEIR